MATVNKNFRVKDGLIVEGTTGTINGHNILTDASTTSSLAEGTNLYYTNERVDDRVANLVSGGTGITITYDDNGNALGISTEFSEFTTSDITEGTNLYFTDERAQDAVAAALANGTHTNITVDYDDTNNAISLTGAVTYTDADARNALSGGAGITYNSTTGEIKTNINPNDGAITTAPSGYLKIIADDTSIWTGGSANQLMVKTGVDSPVAAKTYVTDAVSAHAAETSTHGVTGDIVGTSDVQTLSNKTFSDAVTIGANGSTITGDLGAAGDLDIVANNNLHLTTLNGNIVLNPDGAAYITSASAGNQIATNSYVDNAVAGLAWKEAVHLLYASLTPVLSGDTATLVIDGHEALTSAHNEYRILINDGDDSGIYVYNDNGTTYTLTRSSDADAFDELVGAAVFVMEGTQYGQTSWVQSNHYLTSFAGQSWTQFSGSGSVVAGTGITVNGLEVSVDRTTVDGWYDASGSAAQALADANDYANTNFVNIADLPGQLDDYVPLTQKAANNGVATLDATGDVPTTQLGNVPDAIKNQFIWPSSVNISAGGYLSQGDQFNGSFFTVSKTGAIKVPSGWNGNFVDISGIGGKFSVFARDTSDGSVHNSEFSVAIDGSGNAYVSEYGIVTSGAELYNITVFSVDSLPNGNYSVTFNVENITAHNVIYMSKSESFRVNGSLL